MKDEKSNEKLSEALGLVNDKYVIEALSYNSTKGSQSQIKRWFLTAACFLLVIGVLVLSSTTFSHPVTVYAYGTDQVIGGLKAVALQGAIHDDGEMIGHPLQFYVLGDEIETIRFSCKNGKISFIDWTEKRGDYGLSSNFTVSYGDNKEDCYYLVIDWLPETIISKLTENNDIMICNLSDDEKTDIIVMEICYGNGKKQTMAINLRLMDDGQFTAKTVDYKINEGDNFVFQPDANPIKHQP